jgi:hypothetical protein
MRESLHLTLRRPEIFVECISPIRGTAPPLLKIRS